MTEMRLRSSVERKENESELGVDGRDFEMSILGD